MEGALQIPSPITNLFPRLPDDLQDFLSSKMKLQSQELNDLVDRADQEFRSCLISN